MNSVEKLYESIWKDQATAAAYAGGNGRIDLAIRVVEKGKRLLDLGCADGILAQQLHERFAEAHGADISETALSIARQRGIETHRVNVDEEPLPFADGFFDAITCLDLVEHVFEPRVLLREMARVLAPGGSVYIAFPNIRYIIRIKELIAGRFPKTSGDVEYSYDGGHLHYYTPEDMRRLLEEQGLKPVSEFGIVSGGIRSTWKFRALNSLLSERLARELLSIEVLTRAVKPK
jgi:methionine biosynthesis protein MetW